MAPQPTNTKFPLGMILIGHDPQKNTYHWEGPYGLIWETDPGKMFGWLRGWTYEAPEEVLRLRGRYPLDPEVRELGPKCYLMDPETEGFQAGDDGESKVVDKDGKEVLTIRHDYLFTFKPNPAGDLAAMSKVKSPYTLSRMKDVVDKMQRD